MDVVRNCKSNVEVCSSRFFFDQYLTTYVREGLEEFIGRPTSATLT